MAQSLSSSCSDEVGVRKRLGSMDGASCGTVCHDPGISWTACDATGLGVVEEGPS